MTELELITLLRQKYHQMLNIVLSAWWYHLARFWYRLYGGSI